MSFFGFFRKRDSTASAAKERLSFVLSHERAGRDAPDYLPRLQKDILAAIAKYVPIPDENVAVRMAQEDGTARLEVNIDLPPKAPLEKRRA
ncbi:MAG TPA: cell division topological specificity factor MinE [Kiloniellales bacterium]|jgi:cell division topological specificity factor|nr:cell division topological specificity factor MinE [Kiloniellales bacterium]